VKKETFDKQKIELENCLLIKNFGKYRWKEKTHWLWRTWLRKKLEKVRVDPKRPSKLLLLEWK